MNEKPVDYLNGKLFPMILKFSEPAAISLLETAVYTILWTEYLLAISTALLLWPVCPSVSHCPT